MAADNRISNPKEFMELAVEIMRNSIAPKSKDLILSVYILQSRTKHMRRIRVCQQRRLSDTWHILLN